MNDVTFLPESASRCAVEMMTAGLEKCARV
jgi:hypothetical protein